MKSYKTISSSQSHALDVEMNYWASMGWTALTVFEKGGVLVAVMEKESLLPQNRLLENEPE